MEIRNFFLIESQPRFSFRENAFNILLSKLFIKNFAFSKCA